MNQAHVRTYTMNEARLMLLLQGDWTDYVAKSVDKMMMMMMRLYKLGGL